MSSDQISYVLVALLVAGLATLLLLAGAFIARRGSRNGAPAPASASAAYPTLERPAPVEPAPLHTEVPEPPPVAAVPPAPFVEPEIEPAAAPPEPEPPTEEVGAVTAADLAEAARRVHDPREEEIIEGFLSIAPRRRAADEAPRPPTAVGPGLAAAAAAAPEALGAPSSREPDRAEEATSPVAPAVARPAPDPGRSVSSTR